MASTTIDKDNLFKFKRQKVKIDGKFNFVKGLANSEREIILKGAKKDWSDLVRLSFYSESGIAKSGSTYGRWKPLTDEYEDFKQRNNLLPGILESSSPNLMTRYIKSIKYNSNQFSIRIEYPRLITRGNPFKDDSPVTAVVHQLGTIKRRLVQSAFQETFKQRLIKYFTQ